MLNRFSHTQLLRYAGLFTWAVLGIPLVVFTWNFPAIEAAEGAGGFANPRILLLILAYGAFGLIYWRVTYALGARKSQFLDVVLLAGLTLSAIIVSRKPAPAWARC